MAAESNTGFHQQALSFQSGVIGNSSSQMMLMGDYYSHLGMNFDVNNSGLGGGGGMLYSGNPTMMTNNCTSSSSPRTSQYGSCSGSFLIDTVPGLKHDTGLAVEWTIEELYKLEEGLIKYANEPRIMKYIKIAATLRDKNVRDVALRCRWITRKRRKQEDYSLGKKMKDMKDKLAEMSSMSSASASLMSLAPYSLSMYHHGPSDALSSGAALLGTRHLLEENNQALNKISANLSTFKLQDNVDLFFQTKNNLIAILNNMKNMPGIMSQMPPLPVFLNEELASSLSPSSAQPMMFGCRSGIQLKQEPAC
ncbi:putative CLAVATA3/ESR (CLE)-related protein 25-like [Capsicum annuum]|uniref:Uncharacterized protein n=1 Tax=Capsicum annuum TaxID=4072 RepID=A0A1U8GUH9_CAPAN|nr:uncharacterized protein LOC107870422 isoform X1 [Capsicum annuum]XP_016572439.1 uncharacterized protein LOC107870422 isoform X1 [Capsicum annuum]XP_016572440.1 uncharacterized protein LOC107870422 isoform X1 [Capsicum annuum]XP_047268570.1 uncharacterized protein LOC107870422 isoform X1 [Capsicum annuum]KAF3652155.1 putative CLAVATA3/ESR (CLE)-related protein 25-like [Capsicum annuum]PHT81236.1 hypothetical protein T459_14251 [Capsicum annuum]